MILRNYCNIQDIPSQALFPVKIAFDGMTKELPDFYPVPFARNEKRRIWQVGYEKEQV